MFYITPRITIMRYLLQVDFPHSGPFGEELTNAMNDLAKDIATESGLISKLWTENEATKEAGGIYQFTNMDDAQRYLKKHTERLTSFGYKNIRGKIFTINEALSALSVPQK
ncbi:MAG: Putative mono-oxygenase ydhR [uncultured Sulfurovum sp.]|uniref:Mono-oxygenase ydhR n=1 Tax=uncultured Sulfurovum sp. TaxID=269237 RepID=A0A6S6SWK9_9BACT|nr:MAG: Putative mono-oxygenase ydhR [uncultured Sulfurovum sp.]